MNFKSWFRRPTGKKLAALEQRLDSAFGRVGPSPDFIVRLRKQLVPPPGKRYLGIPAERWGVGVAVFGVLAASVLLVQSGLRLLLGILAAFGILQQVRQAKPEDNDAPLKPA